MEYFSNCSLDLLQILKLSLGEQTKIEYCLKWRRPQWKMTSNYYNGISKQPLIRSSSNFKLKLRRPNQNSIMLKMKTTFNGRRPQNIKSGIFQQPLIISSLYFKLKPMGPNQNWKFPEMKTNFHRRWPKNIKSEISEWILLKF